MPQNGLGVLVLQTIRFFFEKVDTAAYISLLDLQKVMQRAFKRSKLPVYYTQGFNPHIYITFAAPLSLGQQSVYEVLDIKSENDNFNWGEAAQILNPCLPSGIKVIKTQVAQSKASDIATACYKVCFSPQMAKYAQKAFEDYETVKEAIVQKTGKKGKVKEINLKEHVNIDKMQIEENGVLSVELRMPCTNVMNINPWLLFEFLENETGLPKVSADILRTALLLENGNVFE